MDYFAKKMQNTLLGFYAISRDNRISYEELIKVEPRVVQHPKINLGVF